MKLKDYLSALPRGQQAQFAKDVGVNPVYLSQLSSGGQGKRSFRPSPALSGRIERLSGAKVTRRDLRPDDWHEIWPELAAVSTSIAQAATENVAGQGV
jgi:DNA-binding transcriptional regulator YdaS (Cro superfamily)